jgi:hypothetical protein
MQMQICPTFFAYFGPEVQMPLISFIGTIAGTILIIGATPLEVVKRWLQRR